jgi:hypothetical protein
MTGLNRRAASLLAAVALTLVACSPSDRPDTATWLPGWDAIVSTVPDQSALGDPPDADLCESTLAALRTENDDLLPSPSVTVDDLVAEWVAVAEAAFFGCPPSGAGMASFGEAYDELDRIEESVETALSSSS